MRWWTGGTIWRSKAAFGRVARGGTLPKSTLLCKVIYALAYERTMSPIRNKADSPRLSFPFTSNPSRRADFCVHRNTASCVLRHPKPGWCLKTTCPQGLEKHLPKSGFLEI